MHFFAGARTRGAGVGLGFPAWNAAERILPSGISGEDTGGTDVIVGTIGFMISGSFLGGGAFNGSEAGGESGSVHVLVGVWRRHKK